MEAKPAGPPKSRVIAPRPRPAATAAATGTTAAVSTVANPTIDSAATPVVSGSSAPPRRSRTERVPRPPRPAPVDDSPETRGEILEGDVHVASSTNIKTCAGAIAQKLRSFGHTGVIG